MKRKTWKWIKSRLYITEIIGCAIWTGYCQIFYPARRKVHEQN